MRVLVTFAAVLLSGCGYHVSGHTDTLPKTVRTIAIPSVANLTTRYKLSDHLAATLTREFITRTRYKVVADPNQGDATLTAAVISYFSYPIVSDQQTGRATTVQLSAVLNVNLVERSTGKVLFTRPNMEVRQRYEISLNPVAYFEESDVALDRLSREVARSVVSAVLEAF